MGQTDGRINRRIAALLNVLYRRAGIITAAHIHLELVEFFVPKRPVRPRVRVNMRSRCCGRMPTISLMDLVHWPRQRAGRGSLGGFGDMELGRRGVVFDNRIVFDVSASGFDNLTYGNQPRVRSISPRPHRQKIRVYRTKGIQSGRY